MEKINWFFALAALLVSVDCHPSPAAHGSSFPQYVPPGPGDVRSPCPGLNSLANHGFIPHSGKGNTIPVLIKGLSQGFNIGADFTALIGGAGTLSNPKQDPTNPSFDLDHLAKHNFPIEHDSSLSRRDLFFGDNHNFNQTIWNTVLACVPKGSNFNIFNGAKARYNRVTTSKASNPTFTYTPRIFVLSYGETALYLQVMGSSPTKGTAPYDYVQSLFEKERLPYELGWRPSTTPITLASLGLMIPRLVAAAGEPLPEGLILTESTLSTALRGLNPIIGVIGDITN